MPVDSSHEETPEDHLYGVDFQMVLQTKSALQEILTAAVVQDRVTEILLSTGITYEEYILGFFFAITA
jgi:hypothetical protein